MNHEKLELKKKYIPLYVSGKITNKECSLLCNITTVSAARLKKRYLAEGESIFIHGLTGKPSHNTKFSDDDKKTILSWYQKNFSYAPYQVAFEFFVKEKKYDISVVTFSKILNDNGMMSPKAHKPVRVKKLHKPRPEREHEGELIQLDGCKHNWFMNGHRTTIHGAIDDATHKITSLYMTENECLFGYLENLHQTRERFGGNPRAVYTDRSAIFFTTKQSLEKITIQEQLQGYEKKNTQWQKICDELNIETIAALSPEAKGRIERLWETLQGRLPYIFRHFGIDTIEKANIFLKKYVDVFNAQFSIKAKKKYKFWRMQNDVDYDFLFCVKSEHTARADGTFIYHGEKFRVNLPFKTFTLCLSERFGLKAFYNNKYYDVELTERLKDVVGDSMPIVEKDLIRRYYFADQHSNYYSMG